MITPTNFSELWKKLAIQIFLLTEFTRFWKTDDFADSSAKKHKPDETDQKMVSRTQWLLLNYEKNPAKIDTTIISKTDSISQLLENPFHCNKLSETAKIKSILILIVQNYNFSKDMPPHNILFVDIVNLVIYDCLSFLP